MPRIVDATADRVAHGLGLLVDLFEHEVLEAALLCGIHVPLDVNRLGGDLNAVEAPHADDSRG